MKHTLIFLIVILSLNGYSQSAKTLTALSKVEKHTIDDNGYVSWSKIIQIDSLTSDEIFNRAEEFFTYNYGSGESVLQINDRASGRLVGKGLFLKTASVDTGFRIDEVDTYHILRMDIKDHRIRITVSLINYRMIKHYMDGDNGPEPEVLITNAYPINPNGVFKNSYGQAFAGSYQRAIDMIGRLEKILNQGSSEW